MLPPHEATVPVTDAGLQHAVGLFETFQAHGGRVFRLQQHLDRLAASTQELGLAASIDTAPLADAVAQTIRHNRIDHARLRLTVTAGTVSLLRTEGPDGPRAEVHQTVAVAPTPPTTYDPRYFTEGVTVRIHGPGANPFDSTFGHKTLNYWARLRSLRQAATVGAAEAIWLNVTNHLASGAVSNVILVKDGQLLTPFARGEEVPNALPAPVLPGITRAAVIGLAEARGLTVTRRMLTVEDLLGADEVMLTNSGWCVLPVVRVEKHAIGSGAVGAVTRDLRSDLLQLIERETAA